MRSAEALLVAAGALTVLTVGAGCTSESASGSDDQERAGSPATASTAPADCATDLVATYPDIGEVELTGSAEAVALGDGAAYTLYVGDYVIPTEDIEVSTVIPPDGSHLVALFVTAFNAEEPQPPIEPGTTVVWTDETGVLTFSSIFYEGNTDWSASAEASGELTVLDVDDESICVEVDYRDAERILVGTIAAPVHDSPF